MSKRKTFRHSPEALKLMAEAKRAMKFESPDWEKGRRTVRHILDDHPLEIGEGAGAYLMGCGERTLTKGDCKDIARLHRQIHDARKREGRT